MIAHGPRRGQPSRSVLNREYPHQVLVPAWNVRGKRLDKVIAFRADIGARMTTRSQYKNDSWHELYCFADRRHADSFQRLFGGELIDSAQSSAICRATARVRRELGSRSKIRRRRHQGD